MKQYNQPELEKVTITFMGIIMQSNYTGPSMTINNTPTPDQAIAE